MRNIIFILLFLLCVNSVEAQWCGRACTERYYNPTWSINDQWYYGYIEMNDYPYMYPVNQYFNYCPCPNCRKNYNSRYFRWCAEQ